MPDREEASIFRQSVSEADIDWLFCVELNSSGSFRRWVASRLFQDIDEFDHLQAWRSVANVAGESDLLWLVESSASGRVMGLIENKIDAVAQPEQYLRYIRRGEAHQAEGLCQRYEVALLAPKEYRSQDSRSYPIHITYEDVADWLRTQADERSQYLAAIFEAAINKLGSTAPIDDDITDFRRQIWALAQSGFPELNIPDPELVSASQYWVYMRHTGYTLIYKMYKRSGIFTNCVVDLELTGRGGDIDFLRKQYATRLDGTGITVEQTGKSASFRLTVPAIDPRLFEEHKVREALCAARKLKEWWKDAGAV